ncbi:MAG: hypothetical protein AAF519_16490, partial [Bacteroidota bacterium]
MPKPVAKPGKLKSTSKIPLAISEIPNVELEEKTATNTIEPEELYGRSPFSLEQLRRVWDRFAEQKKQEGRDAEYTVLKQDIRLVDEFKIVLTLTNSVKINILDRFRSDLITYLKKELDNGEIVLETELVAEEKGRVLYTNREKFEHLAQKKPILNELKNRLGLDP